MKRNVKTTLFIVLILVLANVSLAEETIFYISPEGHDEWSGTLSEPNPKKTDGPLATLSGARIKVREHLSEGLANPVTVLIRGGEYELDETIVFTPKDSGSKDCPITYRAYRDEKPIFTGGKKLKGWKKVSKEPKGIHENTKGKLWTCNISSELKGTWQITTLYDDRTMLKRSRSSEFKVSKSHKQDVYNAQPKDLRRHLKWDDDPVTFRRDLLYNDQDLKDWDNVTDIEIVMSPKHNWLINILPLEKIDISSKTAYLAVDPTYGFKPENTYFVENAIDYLDEPGEWVFNSKEGRIYIWPESTLADADIRAPYLQEFIRVEGIEDKEPVRFLRFEGLTFRHGLRETWKPGDIGLQHDWDMYDKGNAVLRFRHAEDCSVKACTFEASSGGGVRLDLYCQRINVSDSIFANLGGTGILLSGYGPGTKDENKFNTIINNYIHHAGSIYIHAPGIFISQSGHNLIKNNTIHDLSYTGLVVSGCRPHDMLMAAKPLKHRREWIGSIRIEEIQSYIKDITPEMMGRWLTFDVSMIEPLQHARENHILENEIYNVMLHLHDGNGIYFSGMGKNNRAERNYLHDISGDRGYIRLDDISSRTIMVNNVGVRCSMMFVRKGPAEYRNNFAIDCDRITNKRWFKTEMDQSVFYNRIPGKAKLENKNKSSEEDKYVFDSFERLSNCLLFAEKSIDNVQPGQDLVPVERRGGAQVGMLYADPMFDEEAMKQKIFRFKPGSPAEKLGIDSIDLSQVGSTLANKK